MAAQRTFGRAVDADFNVLMDWFATKTKVRRWGGPEFEFPFTAATFRRDCHWPAMASYSLRDSEGDLLGFGQLYDRDGYINLARVGVRPGSRGQRVGRDLMSRLMRAGLESLALPAYSLYVYRDNDAALGCYRSLGFGISPYPPGEKLADVCYYMTRPVDDDAGGIGI